MDMMRYVSRDANVRQFYGACLRGDTWMLVGEYMEVRRHWKRLVYEQ